MPSVVPMRDASTRPQGSSGVIKFTNCLLVKGNELVNEDLWVSSASGKILNGQEILYEHRTAPEDIVDLGGRILSPGLIDTQLNGAYGFDFSVIPEEGTTAYSKGVLRVNRSLVATGVTSYLPTMTSQLPEVYQKALPSLGPSGSARDPSYGSESLGAHCEGPFLSPTKNGIHNASVLLSPINGMLRPLQPPSFHHKTHNPCPRTPGRPIQHPCPLHPRHPRLNRTLGSHLRRCPRLYKSWCEYDNAPLQRHASLAPP
jgi:N-acetylglucosamine-6-phosphate deacetylase